jgi:Ca2+-binding RTX toxin-like protein
LPAVSGDQDHDGVPDSIDTCPTVFNPEQAPVTFTFVPGNITITKCKAANIGKATATNVCGVTVTNDAPAQFPLGRTVVTWKATDPAGQVATATQIVTAILGDDKSCCPPGTNIIVGTSRSDRLTGTAGSDCILGLGGNDVIDARGGDDFISGGDGNDTIMGGLGNDMIWGGPGIDTIDASEGDDFIDGGDPVNVCAGGTGTNTILNCQVMSGCTAACCKTNTCGP